ncbi:DNA recombination protein RmuC [Cryomorphaceae bacterium 1068]|nr:DNA recombination protein RmuC [Cryomorphaceae bacterium 1068]
MGAETLLLISTLVVFALAIGVFTGLHLAKRKDNSPQILKELEEHKARLLAETEKNEELKQSSREVGMSLERLRDEKERALVLISRLESEKSNVEKQIDEQRADIQTMQEKFTKDFKLIANQIFEEKTESFSRKSKESIDQLLSPLKERLVSFEKKVDETHKDSIKETSGLKTELRTLREMSAKMTEEAENLTKALRNDTKVQGNWGEMILESILEGSGLRKDEEYFLQKSFSSDEGRRFQPDVMIKLPDDKWVIVDSKVSLKAYEDFVTEEDPKVKERHLKNHLISLKNHIKGLSEKKYQEFASGKNLDFILMFVPIEPAYLTALQADHSLFNEAYDRGIVMVSPTTLIASLKIISTTWKHEYQNRNALEIAERGKLLFEKFVGFAEDFEKIGLQIDRTSATYNDAMKKLRDGRGSLVSQAKQLEELGVRANKKLSSNLIADGEDA